jgi:hypothetical protein
MVGSPLLNAVIRRKSAFSSIYSFQMLGASTGMALGGWLGGALICPDLYLVNYCIHSDRVPGTAVGSRVPRHRNLLLSGSKAVDKA